MNCSQNCFCNTEINECDGQTGACLICPIGRSGSQCEQTCPDGTWGINCSQQCKCAKNHACNNVDGSCECFSGFIGEYCELGNFFN